MSTCFLDQPPNIKKFLWKTGAYALGFFFILLGWFLSFYFVASDLKDRPARFNLFVHEEEERNGTVVRKETMVGHVQGFFFHSVFFVPIVSLSILLIVYVVFLGLYIFYDWRTRHSVHSRGPMGHVMLFCATAIAIIFAIVIGSYGFGSSLNNLDSVEREFIPPWTSGPWSCEVDQVNVRPGPGLASACASGDLVGGDPSSVFVRLQVVCGAFAFIFSCCCFVSFRHSFFGMV